jgi:hypothetical protein
MQPQTGLDYGYMDANANAHELSPMRALAHALWVLHAKVPSHSGSAGPRRTPRMVPTWVQLLLIPYESFTM